ncbi:protein of unknown function [Geodermatophilus saharensis]|uniref:DUF4389 domain-containing protein n=1 Tax=Geodermatophilus saharensis TaxID=1137994 RepID=A0A239BSH5_9ACTN|nr:DUF4389 domain-containing protein [Geodermatophilus saharensis]SNS10846.1 protein of unknown function [Geodermatophilus saharensis]
MSEHVSPTAPPGSRPPYPVRVDGLLDARLSRGLWLVKWLLLVPHYVVLTFLWVAVCVVTVAAFFAILVTGRYPRPLFDFTVGVLRWTWRVQHYGYMALGTDRYPPFTLADVPGSPAHLDVPYPERLSRGLVLVKWWLLALPHYLVLAVFVGGGVWLGTGSWDGDGVWDDSWGFGGLVALLVFVAGVVLLVRGRYPVPIYDFVLGMDRWAWRVTAYALLLTDAYPPFRLDLGGTDPGSVPVAPPPVGPSPAGAPATPVASPPASAAPLAAAPPSRWTAGRVTAVVVGSVLVFAATGPLVAGGTLLWADRAERDADGVLLAPAASVDTDRNAVTTDGMVFEGDGLEWVVDELLGTARVEVTPADPGDELFVGVAPTADVERYLRGVGHATVEDLDTGWGIWDDDRTWVTDDVAGGAPAVPPTEAGIWTVEASGTGTQVIDWRPDQGNWTVVVMRADGGAGVAADVRAGATLPGLTWFSVGLLGVGAVLLLVGGLLIGLAVHGARPLPPSGPVPATGRPVVPSPRGTEPDLPVTGRSGT